MWTKKFWIESGERALKTAAQAVLTVVALDQVGFNAIEADWATAGSFALGGLVFSLLTSLISAPVGPQHGSPSLVK